MKKIIKVSIGIPAYNEEVNIKNLLLSLLAQKQRGFAISEIIVISDSSTDNTVSIVKSIKNKKIKLIEQRVRKGKSYCIKQILQKFNGDILFLLDADISIFDKNLFKKIILNNDINKFGLIGVNAMPIKARNTFQKIINSGFMAMREIAYAWNNGQNYLLYKGCFLGFSRSFAKSINIHRNLINNDAFFYFKARELGFVPRYYKYAKIYYHSPANLSDHLKQSNRFKSSKNEMENYFKSEIKSEYKIPVSLYLKVISKSMYQDPIIFINYLFVQLFTEMRKANIVNPKWSIASSTKKI